MKKRFYSGVIRYRRAIMLLFAVITAVSAFMIPKVKVNYDLADYLPQEYISTKSISFMKSEFGDMPNARVVLRDVSQKEVLDYKARLEALDGVESVTWLDSVMPASIPADVLPEGITDVFYKGGNALLILTVNEDKQYQTIPEIYDLIGEDNQLSGNAVTTVVAAENTVSEGIVITIAAILIMLLVLTVTTTSWLEPLVIMFGLIVAVIINTGTNLIFGSVSFLTSATGMLLQIAVALDYSVFLIHRFESCRSGNTDPEEAMAEALTLSSSSIVSSGLTTIIGFLALATMKFLIGKDLGLALSKGVAICLITTLVFMPGVILGTYRLMEKTRHRRLVPSFDKFGRFVLRVTVPLMIVFAVLVIPSYILSERNTFWYGGSHMYGPETREGGDRLKIAKAFGDIDSYVIMVPRGDTAGEIKMIEELREDERITMILSAESFMGLSLPSDVLPESLIGQLQSDDYDRLVLTVAEPPEGDETFELVADICDVADKYYPGSYYLTGSGVINYDLRSVVTSDRQRVNLIAILAVFLILIVTMHSLLFPVILVLVIESAIWFNLSISFVSGSTLFYISFLIISSVQLGATVDYAILFAQRYRENRIVHDIPPKESILKTVNDNTASIMTSALALSIIGFLLAAFSSHGMIAQLGLLLGRGTLCSLFAVLFVLPGLLMTFDRYLIRKGSDTAFQKDAQ